MSTETTALHFLDEQRPRLLVEGSLEATQHKLSAEAWPTFRSKGEPIVVNAATVAYARHPRRAAVIDLSARAL